MFLCSFLYFTPFLLYGSVLSVVYINLYFLLPVLFDESGYFLSVCVYVSVFDADRSVAIKGICF